MVKDLSVIFPEFFTCSGVYGLSECYLSVRPTAVWWTAVVNYILFLLCYNWSQCSVSYTWFMIQYRWIRQEVYSFTIFLYNLCSLETFIKWVCAKGFPYMKWILRHKPLRDCFSVSTYVKWSLNSGFLFILHICVIDELFDLYGIGLFYPPSPLLLSIRVTHGMTIVYSQFTTIKFDCVTYRPLISMSPRVSTRNSLSYNNCFWRTTLRLLFLIFDNPTTFY